jgi:urease accessory protein
VSTLDTAALLTTLQHGDSFFPSGGIAFSWGLETLHAQGFVRERDSLTAFLRGQLERRWATCDRVALVRAFEYDKDLTGIARVDFELEALSLARELREGSSRAGAALLRVHEQLATPHAAQYRALIRSGGAVGHLPVVQGLVWRHIGVSMETALTLSAHTHCVGILGAALRLGIIGHLDAQRVLQGVRALLAELIAQPIPDEMSTFAPAAEIAAMRHETQHSRLFAN